MTDKARKDDAMCGRYAIIDGKKVLATFPLLRQVTERDNALAELPRYNAAPMQRLPVIANRDGTLVAERMQWWLIPHWSKEPKSKFSTFNAKCETIEKSRLFGPYFKSSRCLVPADAFYEWKKETVKKDVGGRQRVVSVKQPYCVRMKDETPFMFAGIFSVWKDAEKEVELASFAILTTEPNDLMSRIHNRMPVILSPPSFEQWLDRENHDSESLKKLLHPYSQEKMKAYPVSRIVNSGQNDVKECIVPLKE